MVAAARYRRLAALQRFLDSSLSGLTPWIVFNVVAGPRRLELSCVLALGSALVIMLLARRRGGSLRAMELWDVSFFGLLSVVVALASDSTHGWLELWAGEIANLTLVAFALGSIVVRRPFTLPYARESTPRELWGTPTFLHVNYVISGAWAAVFVIAAASGAYGDAVLHDSNNVWTGWVIQTLPLILAGYFTSWYPGFARARARVAQGLETAPPPPVSELLVSVTGWLAVVGLLLLVLGGAPTWVGAGLVLAGIVLTRGLARRAAARRGGRG